MRSYSIRLMTLINSVCVAALCLSPLEATAVGPWENPNLSPNPWNNIHNQSWFNDSYLIPGPTEATGAKVEPISNFTFMDPITGRERTVTLGLCAAHTYTLEGNFASVCAGFPNPLIRRSLRSIVHISPDGELLAYHSFFDKFDSILDVTTAFGGAGYFYQDQKDRLVTGMPDGNVVAWKRAPSDVGSPVNKFVRSRNIRVIEPDGPVPSRIGSFYAVLPDADGYIWFTTSQGVVGTIAPMTPLSGST